MVCKDFAVGDVAVRDCQHVPIARGLHGYALIVCTELEGL